VYNPQCNGLVERFDRTIGGYIKTALLTGKSNMEEEIRDQLVVYRNTPHPLTGVPPAVLLRGRRLRSTLTVDGIVKTTNVNLQNMKEKVRLHQSKMLSNRVSSSLKVGDLVRIRKPGILLKDEGKLSPPVEIVAQQGANTFRTSDGRTWSSRRLASRAHCIGYKNDLGGEGFPLSYPSRVEFRQDPKCLSLSYFSWNNDSIRSESASNRTTCTNRSGRKRIISTSTLVTPRCSKRARVQPAKLSDFVLS